MFTSFLPAKSRFRYIRFYVVEMNGGLLSGEPVGICDLRYLIGAVVYPTANMTANNTPSPLLTSASLVNPVSDGAYQAFDSSSTTRWIGGAPDNEGPQWVLLDFGAGNELRPLGFRILPESTRFPSAFQVQGSNIGTFSGEHRVLYSASGVTAGWSVGVARTFSF